MQDQYHSIKDVAALAPQAITSNTEVDGASVDRTGWEAVTFSYQVGSYSDGDFTITIQHADDDGAGSPDTWADVADADLLGTEAGAALSAAGIGRIGYIGGKKWVRIQVAGASVTSGASVSATAILGMGRHLPYDTQAVT